MVSLEQLVFFTHKKRLTIKKCLLIYKAAYIVGLGVYYKVICSENCLHIRVYTFIKYQSAIFEIKCTSKPSNIAL